MFKAKTTEAGKSLVVQGSECCAVLAGDDGLLCDETGASTAVPPGIFRPE